MITLIHRQETVSLLGIPISKYIDIDDAEVALRAIRLTPADKGIDLILHTPGGLVLAASLKKLQGQSHGFYSPLCNERRHLAGVVRR